MSDAAGLGCSEMDGTRTGAETAGVKTIDDDGSEGAESKVDIITPDKTNKIPILISC